jgi:hypothetical protein
MGPFEVRRKNKKTKQVTITTGIRCKWCKKAEGKMKKEIIDA